MPTHRPAGGISSKNTHHFQDRKSEPTAHAIRPSAASQIGIKTAYPKDELVRGSGYATPVGPTQSVAGPGGGRDLHPSGSQQGLKPAQPLEPGRDLFEGPEIKIGR